jgi:hypothetical protein
MPEINASCLTGTSGTELARKFVLMRKLQAPVIAKNFRIGRNFQDLLNSGG